MTTATLNYTTSEFIRLCSRNLTAKLRDDLRAQHWVLTKYGYGCLVPVVAHRVDATGERLTDLIYGVITSALRFGNAYITFECLNGNVIEVVEYKHHISDLDRTGCLPNYKPIKL